MPLPPRPRPTGPARATARAGRDVVVAAVAVVALLTLSGCAALDGLVPPAAPVRDAQSGEIVEASEADAFALRVGDCLDLTPTSKKEESVEFMTVPTVPCGDPHDGEVYFSHLMPDGDYPGEDAVLAATDEVCMPEFGTFIGLPWKASVLDFTTFFPTQESWDYMSDREILCIAVDPMGGVSGSLAGAAR